MGHEIYIKHISSPRLRSTLLESMTAIVDAYWKDNAIDAVYNPPIAKGEFGITTGGRNLKIYSVDIEGNNVATRDELPVSIRTRKYSEHKK